jgi:hypothetical protein
MSDPTQTDAAAPETPAAVAAKINSGVATALGAADDAAAQRVQGLVHQARLAQLTRTAANVTAQYGAGSPQATAAEDAVTTAQGTVARAAVVSQRVSTPAPQVAATGWVLHGRVYNAQLQPASAYCVFLVDAQNAYQGAYGFAYTDTTGYFLLNFAGAPTPAQPAQGATAQPPPQLFVEVANASGQPVYLDSMAFQSTLGAATYRNVTLPAGEKPIGNPPPAVRKTALPPAKKGS